MDVPTLKLIAQQVVVATGWEMFHIPTIFQSLAWSMERLPIAHGMLTRDVLNMMQQLTRGHLTRQ